jgi:hypothetical protein
MKRVTLNLSTALFYALLGTAAFAQVTGHAEAGPVPPALLAAKSLFVSNAGSDSMFFPDSFSGDANRPYSEFYAALKATGKYDVVSDPSQADLVLNLRLVASYCPSCNYPRIPLWQPMFRLTVYERKTHYLLWTVTEPIESALLLKNHDRNFENALTALIGDFEKITGRATTAP